MFKSAKLFLVVDSVDKAIKFYCEKLLFSIVDLRISQEGGAHAYYAELRRGKCSLVVRLPSVDELAEFSMVRRCSGRAAGLVLELKKDLDRFYKNCQGKKLSIDTELGEISDGVSGFSLRDPFGIRICFFQIIDKTKMRQSLGDSLSGAPVDPSQQDKEQSEVFVDYLKSLGVARRVAKKYIKLLKK